MQQQGEHERNDKTGRANTQNSNEKARVETEDEALSGLPITLFGFLLN